jgi:tetratricopeptide (TPR) repeat protein
MSTESDPAFEAFLAADLDVASFLALDDADLDGEAFAKAQKQSRKGPKDKRAKAAEKLAEMLADVRSGPALDQVVASAFDRAERWADALEVRKKALALGGAWHPVHAGRIVGNVGHDLQKLGDLAAAATWFERALSFDPTNPFVVESLAEVALARGDLATAFGMREYLGSMGLPASFAEDFDAAARKVARPKDVAAYVPDLSRLRALSDEGYARCTVATLFDQNGSEGVAFRNHALACAMRGDFDHARLAAETGAALEEEGPDAIVERAWAQALVRALSARGEPLDPDPDQRLAAAADPTRLRAALHDFHPLLRVTAAERLGADVRGDALLRVQAAMEARRGVAYRHAAQTGLTATRVLRMRKAQAAGARPPIVVPAEGADHPVFSSLKEGEVLAVWLSWDEPITQDLAQKFGVALQKAAARTAQKDPKAGIRHDADPFSIAIFLLACSNDPQAAVRAVLEEIAGVGASPGDSRLAPREVVVARVVPSDTGGISHAVPDPRMDVDADVDHAARWAASFDASRRPPASEPEGGLFISMPSLNGNVPELRLMPLFFPDVRVVYGLPEVTERERPARADDLAGALARALDARFRGLPPGFYGKGDRQQRVDAIASEGRAGYAFALSGLTADMVVHLPHTFRFREYELFAAIADVVRELSLAPAVHWYRGEGTWIVNLWENG